MNSRLFSCLNVLFCETDLSFASNVPWLILELKTRIKRFGGYLHAVVTS